MRKLLIVATHPIQYQAHWFAYLSKSTAFSTEVFFLWDREQSGNHDRGFGTTVVWDVPLTDGYKHSFIENTSSEPGTHHFNGLHNPGLLAAIKDVNPDAILCLAYRYRSLLPVFLTSWENKPPVLFRGDSTTIVEEPFPQNAIKKIALSYIFAKCSAALCVGNASKEYFKKYGFPEERIFFAPHSVRTDLFSPQNREQGTNDDTLRFFFSGKLDDNKQVLLLIQCFLEAELENAELHVIGEGIHGEAVREISKKHEQIHFHGFVNQSNLPALYSKASIMCLPSKSETWGLVAQEAAQMGIPALVSSSTGIAFDLVVPEETGYVFDVAGGADSLRTSLQQIATERSRLAALGEAALAKVSRYGIEDATRGLTDALHFVWGESDV